MFKRSTLLKYCEISKFASSFDCLFSPGFSAKYCTYSMMDDVNKNVVHFELVQVSVHTSFSPLYDMVTLLNFFTIYFKEIFTVIFLYLFPKYNLSKVVKTIEDLNMFF